jgi:hypothetical protein
MQSYLPVRPLLVKHTMTAVPASDRLSALERHVHVAVAALVVDGARGCVDLRGGRWVRGGLLGVVGCGHFGGLVAWACGGRLEVVGLLGKRRCELEAEMFGLR